MPLSPVAGVPGLYYAKKVVDEDLEARLFEAVGTLSKKPKASADYSRWAQQWDDPSMMPEVCYNATEADNPELGSHPSPSPDKSVHPQGLGGVRLLGAAARLDPEAHARQLRYTSLRARGQADAPH
jgi:hypothetical protein